MSKLTYLFLFLPFVAQPLLAQESAKGIVFEEMQWEDAMKKAADESKLVFIEGYVEWSEPCAVLEEYTLTDKEVGDYYNANFVNLQVDMEDYLGLELTEMFDVMSYPVFLFLDADGNLVHQGCGAIDSNGFISMGMVAKSDSSISQMQQRFEGGERSLDFLVDYSLALEDACMDNSAFVNAYFEGTNQHDWMSKESWTMINLNISDPYSEQFQYLIAYHDMFSLKYGKDTVDAKVYNVMLDQLIAIYEGADLTLFATQALKQLMAEVDFQDKDQLLTLANLKVNDLKEDWPSYAANAVTVVSEQEVTDPDQLNEFGWKFYLFVDKTAHLEAAAAWMKEVLRDYPDATYYDTYASLKYKLGAVKEAVKFSELAMQAAEIAGEDLMHYKTQLDLFRSGK